MAIDKFSTFESLLKWSSVIGLKDHKNTINVFYKHDPSHGHDEQLNNAGHRGPDFKSGVEFLAVGCSVTYGIGLSHEGTWPYKLAQLASIGDNYNVMGYPGKSLPFMQRQILEYFHEYGLPKKLILMAPDGFRLDYFGLDENIVGLKAHNRFKIEKKLKDLDIQYVVENPNDEYNGDIYTKSIPYLYYIAATSLVQISRICKLLGVEFYWTSWSRYDLQTSRYLLELDDLLGSTYIDLRELDGNFFLKDSGKYLNCHQEENTGSRFYIGDDLNHWGTHYHTHVAEDLYNAIDLGHGN